LKVAARWVVIARVCTNKLFRQNSFIPAMNIMWKPAKNMTFRAIEKPFYVKFQCVGDWQRAMEEGPWLFCDWPVLLKEYDGFSKIDMGDMNSIEVFVRAMKVPDGLINKAVAKVMGNKVGEFVCLAVRNFIGDFVRSRVWLKMDKPLIRFVHVKLQSGKPRKAYWVMYEKIPQFCEARRRHKSTECGDESWVIF
jgi:hypothetical protein